MEAQTSQQSTAQQFKPKKTFTGRSANSSFPSGNTTEILEVIDQATQMVVIGDDLYANPCGACRQAIRDYVNDDCLVWWNTESGWTNLPAAELMKGR